MGVRYEIEGIDWLRAHVDFDGEGCLLWPRFRDVNGYGRVSVRVDGKTKIRWAHRVMCELVNGPCPPDHEAAHSCGRGKFGCVHPKHLEWKTQTANQIDRAQHGTKSRGAYHLHPKLTPEKVREIRRTKGGTETQREIAALYGVTDATIRDIYTGRSWPGI